MRAAWEYHAEEWIRFARKPDHDHYYWRFNLPAFLEILPPPRGPTLDLGCGEGRLTRALHEDGYDIVGIDPSATLVNAAASAGTPALLADAEGLPMADGSVDLVVAFMSLHDMDDPSAALGECARVLRSGGRLCAAIRHPMDSAGAWATRDAGSSFTISDYFAETHRQDSHDRDGVTMTFNSRHRPITFYSDAIARARLVIEHMAEPIPPPDAIEHDPRMSRYARIPCFLHIRALKP